MQEKLHNTFLKFWDSVIEMVPNLIIAGVILAVFILIGIIAGRLFRARQKKRDPRSLLANFGGGILKWAVWLLGGVVALHLLGFGNIVGSLIAGAGVSAIIVGFAFKDIAENFLAGVLLAVNRPFKSGDIVEVGGFKGVVKSLDLRTVYMRVADGRDIFIPNSMIVTSVLTNFTRDGLIRYDFAVGLDTEADLTKARLLILETLRSIPEVLSAPAPDVVVEELGESTVNIRVLLWVDQFTGMKDPAEGEMRIKSRAILQVRDNLLTAGFSLPSAIRELKIYDKEDPIPLKINKEG